MNPLVYVFAALTLALGVTGFGLYKSIQANGELSQRIEQYKADAEQARKDLAEQKALAKTVQQIDTEHYAKLQAARNEIDRLRTLDAMGSVSLSVNATCPRLPETTGTGSMGDGTAAELNPIARSAYYDHRNGIETITAQIIACQRHVGAITQ